jgi:hypothetical protein
MTRTDEEMEILGIGDNISSINLLMVIDTNIIVFGKRKKWY